MSEKYEKAIHFGKYRGMTIEEIPSEYLTWLRDYSESCGDDIKEAADYELDFRTKHKNHFYESCESR